MSRVVIYGGAFDPPTIGHMAVIRWLAAHPELEEVWVVPVVGHAFAKQMASYSDRTLMLLKMVQESKLPPKVKIVLRQETYTVEMVENLQVQHPEHRWVVAVGADILTEASKWHRWEDLCRIAEILVVSRKGYEGSTLGEFPQVSSTEVRTAVREGRDWTSLVTPAVEQVIREHGLYLEKSA